MTYSLMAILFFSINFASADEMKGISEALHGDKMVVEYVQLNNGRYVLMAKEIVQQKGQEPRKFKDHQTVDLNLKANEQMSIANGFKCNTLRSNDFIYAVISKSKANQKGTFHPERAWAVEEKKFKLKPVKPNAVQCKWTDDGDAKYPF